MNLGGRWHPEQTPPPTLTTVLYRYLSLYTLSAVDVFPTRQEISDLVHAYFDSQGEEVSYDPEHGRGTFGDAEFSVHNLAANLARIDRDKWPNYLAWHFGHLLEGGPPQLPSSYEQVRKRLRVRLASDGWVDALPFREIARPVAEDLHEVLMVSIDRTAVSVPPDSIETWGEPLDRLWADARENTVWEEPRERRSLLRPTGERFTWVRGSWWAASLLLDLGRYLSPRNPDGALAMVPVRDALFFHEIVDEGAVTSLAAMVQLGLQFHFEGPDSISPHVYWWRDGEIQRVVSYESDRLNGVWGADFKRMLAKLESAASPAN
jgi:hypothetical protein